MSDPGATIGERVYFLRAVLFVTQAQLADMLGVHPMTVSKWERGCASPALADMARLILLERGAPRAASREANGFFGPLGFSCREFVAAGRGLEAGVIVMFLGLDL